MHRFTVDAFAATYALWRRVILRVCERVKLHVVVASRRLFWWARGVECDEGIT